MSRVIDISNYLSPSANDDYAGFVNWVKKVRDEFDVSGFIVQGIIPPPRYGKSQTSAQCKGILEAGGVFLAGYVYPFFGNGRDDCKARLATFDEFKEELVEVWLDLEDVTSPLSTTIKCEIVDAWLEDCDKYKSKEAGIYTGPGVWDEMGFPANLTRWATRKCWYANYNGNEDISQAKVTVGGFSQPVLYQYAGSTSLFGYVGLDLSVISLDYLASITNNKELDVPVTQEYKDKFGCEDWPCVAANLEGIIHELVMKVGQSGGQADEAVSQIKEVLTKHGY